MATEPVITAKVDTSSGVKSIKDLQNQVKQYRNELVNLERGTKEYNEALKNAADTQGQLNKINDDLRASTTNLTGIYQNVTGAISGLAGGFAAFQGVLGLTNQDTEEFQKTLIKLQSALALSQGLSSLSNGVKSANIAFKAFNTTLLANPLVAIAAAIIAVSAAVAGLIVVLRDNNKETDEATIAYNKYLDAIKEINEEQEYYIRLMRARGATQREVDAKLIADQENVIRLLKEAIGTLEIYETTWVDTLFNTDKAISNAVNRKRISELTDQLDEENKKLVKLNKDRNVTILKDVNDSIKLVDKAIKDSEQKRISDAKKAADEADRIRKKQADDEKRTREQQEKDLKSSNDALIKQRQQLAKEQELADADELGRLEILRNRIALDESRLELARIELTDPDIGAERRIELTNLQREAELELYNNRIQLGKETEALQAYWNANELKRLEDERKAKVRADKEKEDSDKKLLATRQKNFQLTAQLLSNSAALFAQDTVAFKALSAASAVISTYAGANQVLADPTLGFYGKIAGVASTVALGLANVLQIYKTDIPGGNDNTGGTPDVSLPSFPETIRPDETFTSITSADEDFFNQMPQAVLVVEELDEAQNRVNVRISETGF